MNFKEALNRHLTAIKNKDLKALKKTIPADGHLTMLMSDGEVIEAVDEYLELHEEWFQDKTWTIEYDIVFLEESSEMCFAITESDYFDKDEENNPFHLTLFTTFIFRKVEGDWILVHCQHTEADEEEEESEEGETK